MKIYIISKVRGAKPAFQKYLEKYTEDLEREGHQVWLPHRDADQKATGLQICKQNHNAIVDADEIHLFYDPSSQGTHFDLGISFALKKKIRIIGELDLSDWYGFPLMVKDYIEEFENVISNEEA